MTERQLRKIAEKLLGLCGGEPLPSHKTSGNGHCESCQRDAIQAAEIQGKHRRAYHKKVLEVLGDDADDWLFIRRTFEDFKSDKCSELKNMRQEILLHTDPDKHENWLEAQGSNFGPNKHLKSLIERFCNELRYEAEWKGQEGSLDPKAPESLQKLLWIWKHGRKHWKLILSAIAIFLIWTILAKFDLMNRFLTLIKDLWS